MNEIEKLLKLRGTMSDEELLDKISKLFSPAGKVRKIPGIENYVAASDGQIISLEREVTDSRGRKRLIKQKVLSKTVLRDGRNMVSINGRPHQLSTLIAKAFVENPYGYHRVEHINGDSLDDRAVNLIWSQKGY